MNRNKLQISFQIFTVALALLFAIPVKAQLQSKVVIVNGGLYESVPPFGDYVTVAIYDPATRQYAVKDTISPDQSVQDLEIYGDTAFIVTDGGISTFKLPDLTPISRNGGIKGIRNIIVVGSKVYGARGFGALPGEGFVYVFDRNTLAQTSEVTGIPTDCDDIILGGSKIYVSMPGEFGSDTGSIIRINPITDRVDSIIRLGQNGNGISKLAVFNNKLTAFSTLGFGSASSSYSTYDWRAHSLTLTSIPASLGYTTPAIVADTLFGDIGGSISRLNYTTGSAAFRAIRVLPFAGLAVDTLQNQFYVSSADFTSNAKLYTMTGNGSIVDSIEVGIAPEKIAVFYQQATSITKGLKANVSLYPNPATTMLTVQGIRQGSYRIIDMTGRVQASGALRQSTQSINISTLSPGIYNFAIHSDKGHVVQRFVKI